MGGQSAGTRHGRARNRAEPTRACAHLEGRRHSRARARGRHRCVVRRRPRRRVGQLAAVRLAADGGHECSDALAGRGGQGAPCRRRGRRGCCDKPGGGGGCGELVRVEYEPLPAVLQAKAALADDAPLVHEEFGTNRCYTWKLEAGEVDRLFAEADVVVGEHYHHNRLIPNAIEPRAVFVQTVPADGRVHALVDDADTPHPSGHLIGVCGIPEAKLRVIAPDVGGGFGSKLNVYAEEAIALVSREGSGGRSSGPRARTEGYLGTTHGRGQSQEIELAATSEGRITAVRAQLIVDFGAYLQVVTTGTPLLGAWLYGGAYAVEAYGFECTGVFTNATPTDAYRGAGRPEATYAIERAVDALARKLGKDPVELRRRQLHPRVPGDDRVRADDRLRRLRRPPRPRARAPRLRRAARRAGGRRRARAIRDSSGSASPPTSRCAGSRRRASSARSATPPAGGTRDDPLPPDRHGAGAHRHLAAGPGPRDDVRPDRRRPARLRGRRGRGPARRHVCSAARHGHVRQPQPRRRRRRAYDAAEQADREGKAHRGTSLEVAEDDARLRSRRVHRAPTRR